MLDHLEKTALADSLDRIRRAKSLADKYGLKLIAYEGGQHMVAFLKAQDLVKQVSSTMHACNRHPDLGATGRAAIIPEKPPKAVAECSALTTGKLLFPNKWQRVAAVGSA